MDQVTIVVTKVENGYTIHVDDEKWYIAESAHGYDGVAGIVGNLVGKLTKEANDGESENP